MGNYLAYLDETEFLKKQESEALRAAGKKDETNLKKIEANLVGIFRAVYLSGVPFEEKINAIKAPWEARLESAKAHGDFETVAQEERKLLTHEALMAKWRAQHDNC
jgi:hypothetical protein